MIAPGGVSKNRSSKSGHHPLRNSHAVGGHGGSNQPAGHLEKALNDWMADENNSGGASSRGQFQHAALPSPRSIRLLRLLPAREDDAAICVEVFTADLDAATEESSGPPAYEAISYVWGEDALRRPRHIAATSSSATASAPLAIPENLFHALRHLRSASTARVLWADAACIHRENPAERASQVEMMGDVFERASAVLAWLGVDDEGASARVALQLVRDVNAHFESEVAKMGGAGRIEERVMKVPPLPDGHPLLGPSSFTAALTSSSPSSAAARWTALVALLRRPWFFRLWVLQEVGRARRCVVHCGRASLSFADVIQFAVLFNRRSGDFFPSGVTARVGALCDVFHSTWAVRRRQTGHDGEPGDEEEGQVRRQTWLRERPILDEMLQTNWRHLRPSLVQVLQYTRAFHCADARDHVYALLGHPLIASDRPPPLQRDGGALLVRADYARDVAALNALVTRRIIEATRSLEPLGCVEHDPDAAADTAGRPPPSWVPAWHRASGVDKLAFPGDASLAAETRADCFRADFFSLAAPNASSSSSPSGADALRTSGIIFDAVAATTRQYRWRDYDVYSSPLPTRQQLNVVEECWRLCESRAGGAGGADGDMVPNKQAYANKMFVLLWTLLGGTYGSGSGNGGAGGAGAGGSGGGSDVEKAQADFRRYVEVKCTPAFSYRVGKVLPPVAAADRRRETGGAGTSAASGGGYYAGDWKRFRIEAGKKGHLRKFFVTRKGGYGLGPAVQAGDLLAVLFGAGMPVVIRPAGGEGEDSARYRLIGECFVHGAMSGSVIHSWRNGKFRRQDIVLV